MSASGPAPPESLIYGNSILSVISFCFTFLTLLRVIWSSIETLFTPAQAIHLALANMKSSLYEERELTRRAAHDAHHFGRQRRRRPSGSGRRNEDVSRSIDERSSRVLAEGVKQFCRQFLDLEKPFLRHDVDLGKGNEHFNTGREYGIDEFGGFQGDYAPITLYHRFVWLRRRSAIVELMNSLQRLQVRRIGIETASLGSGLRTMERNLGDLRLIRDPSSRRFDDEEMVHVRRGRYEP